MLKEIRISCRGRTWQGILNDSRSASALAARLPLTLSMARWGEEYYGDLGDSLGLKESSDAREEMEVGEIAYWPAGNALCFFFGPTPVSSGTQPRAASPVNPVGRIEEVAGLSGLGPSETFTVSLMKS